MGKYERAVTMDEMVDEDLQELGVRFTDRTKEIPRDASYQKVRKRKKNDAPKLAALAAADGLLIYMCMAGKIELIYGLVFLAAASAFFGGRVNRACV
jgi:hypothetical protein